MDKKYLSSSASGYIIIAKLTEGIYRLTISSPLNDWSELNVTLNVKDANTGYLLKRLSDKNYTLVNLQTQALMTAEQKPPPVKTTEIISEGDGFAKMLAEVVNDPSIGQFITIKQETEPTDIAAANKTAITPETIQIQKTDPAKQWVNASPVSKLTRDSTGGGILLTYMVKSDSENDTVKLFIPVRETIITEPKEKAAVVKTDTSSLDMALQNSNVKADSGVLKKADLVISEKKTTVNTSAATDQQTKKDTLNTSKGITNTNCKKEATQNDLLKLRKQMAAAENEREMTKTAGRQFSLTCFTTEQIRSLGLLYITEDERYKFYVASFPYVTDMQNFAALEDQLSDIYYKTRFKAMLSNTNTLKD